MNIERLSRAQSVEAMKEWMANPNVLPVLKSGEYKTLREDLTKLYNDSLADAGGDGTCYKMDVCYAASLFAYFKIKPWFTLRLASDDGFWRYLSLKVVPDLVGKRWGNDNADHYYVKPSRIWLKTLWWYINLSLVNEDVAATRSMLLTKKFSTDTILNLVERTGRGGTNIDVYRKIMSGYSGRGADGSDKDFRKIMKLHTAKSVVIEPVLYEGGTDGYADSLFTELGM